MYPNNDLDRPEREIVTKHQQLQSYLMRRWNLIVGAIALVKRNLPNYLASNSGASQPSEVQLAAIKVTISIIKRTLSRSMLS